MVEPVILETREWGRIQVAVLTSSFAPREGGAERQLRQVFGELQKAGTVNATIYTEAIVGQPRTELMGGLRVRRVPVGRVAATSMGSKPAYGAFLFSRLVSDRPDVVVSSQLGVATLVGGAYARTANRSLIVRLSGAGPRPRADSWDHFDPLEQQSKKWPFLKRILCRSDTRIVAPAEHMLVTARNLPCIAPRNIHRIPNGVELHTSRRRPGRDRAIWYGRNSPVKYVDAFDDLVRRCPTIEFDSVGAVEVDARPNLTQHGWVADPEELIATATVAVSTSRSEGSPNFALQAIGHGVRVVGFEIPALAELSEIFPDHVDLVPMGDTAALASATHAAMRAGRLAPAAVPNMASVAAAWQNLLQECVSSKAN